jgi:hypothetical protein
MQLEVWILTDDLTVAREISNIFRNYDTIPQYFRSISHLLSCLKNSSYHLIVLDTKFEIATEMDKTILLASGGDKIKVPNIGIVYREFSLQEQIDGIMLRVQQFRSLKKDNQKFRLLNQAFSHRNENLNVVKEETLRKNQLYNNLWNLISLFSLKEEKTFVDTCIQVFDNHEKIEQFAFLVRDNNKWISCGQGNKIIILETLLNFNIRDAAKRLAEERMGDGVVILHITDEELNLDKLIFLKANADMAINWFTLENYLSLMNNYFRFQELKYRMGQELIPGKFLEKLREVNEYRLRNRFYLEVSFKKISHTVVDKNLKFIWPDFLRELTTVLIKYSPNLFITQWGIERLFVLGHSVSSSAVIKLIEKFPVWRFFAGRDKPLSQDLIPTVKVFTLGEKRESYALQN